jgi:hypothetical protein
LGVELLQPDGLVRTATKAKGAIQERSMGNSDGEEAVFYNDGKQTQLV